MYSKSIVFFFFTLFAAVVTAIPNNPVTVTVTATATAPAQTVVSQCNTGNALCCNVVGTSSSNAVSELLGLLGVVLGDVTGLVGLGCTSLTLGLGGSTCSSQAVCCTGNQFNGLVNVGCNNLSL